MEAIVIEGLCKRFGPVAALADVNLTVREGEIVCLLGPNGAGKSTLLRILGTTVLPDEGTAFVAGHDAVADPRAVRRSVGLVLGDERSWYWRLTGRQNLEFFAVLYGLRRRGAALRAERLLHEVGLGEAADRRFDGYSSGMRARLSLARALIAEPPVLLLDEPTRNLDPAVASEFRESLVQLSEQGTAVLLATHDLHEAAQIAAVVVALVRGRLSFTKRGDADASELERVFLAAID